MPDAPPDAPPAPPASRPDAARLAAEPATACLNCGAALPGDYCPDCGQRAEPLRVPLGTFLAQSFAEFFGVDGRLWRTLGSLLFRPGALTTAYLQGRRRRTLSPLRVYLLATVSFFLLLALLDPVGRVSDSLDGDAAPADSLVRVRAHLVEVEARIAAEPARVDPVARAVESAEARESVARALAVADSARAALDPVDPTDGGWGAGAEAIADGVENAEERAERARENVQKWRFEAAMLRALPPDSLVRLADVHQARAQIFPEVHGGVDLPEWMSRSQATRQLERARSGGEMRSAATTFARQAIGHIPTVLFLVLPVFGLLLKALYARRGWYYSEHLVFGLHTHAFAFAVFSVIALLASVGGGADGVGILALVLLASIPVYFLIAQKRVYGQGWGRTAAKAVALGLVYQMVLYLGLAGVVVLAAALG